MRKKPSSKAKQKSLRLGDELTIQFAQQQKQALLAALATGPVVELDLSNVTEVDSAGVQLLVLGKRHAAQHDTQLHFRTPSAAVSEVLDLLGLTSQLLDPPATTSESRPCP